MNENILTFSESTTVKKKKKTDEDEINWESIISISALRNVIESFSLKNIDIGVKLTSCFSITCTQSVWVSYLCQEEINIIFQLNSRLKAWMEERDMILFQSTVSLSDEFETKVTGFFSCNNTEYKYIVKIVYVEKEGQSDVQFTKRMEAFLNSVEQGFATDVVECCKVLFPVDTVPFDVFLANTKVTSNIVDLTVVEREDMTDKRKIKIYEQKLCNKKILNTEYWNDNRKDFEVKYVANTNHELVGNHTCWPPRVDEIWCDRQTRNERGDVPMKIVHVSVGMDQKMRVLFVPVVSNFAFLVEDQEEFSVEQFYSRYYKIIEQEKPSFPLGYNVRTRLHKSGEKDILG